MSMIRRPLSLAAAVAGLALTAAMPAQAQDFPQKPITMIIPLGAGGSHDLNARVITAILPDIIGEPVVVQLMPGAAGQSGTAAAARAAPDGYTLLYTHNFIDELQQHVTELPYDPNEDFVAVARPNFATPIVVVRADSQFATLKELLDYGRQHPGELKFGHSGNWGAFMVPGAALLQQAGVEATLVPYQGGGPVMQGLLAGDIDFTMAFPSVFSGQEQQLTALAVVGDEKLDILPDVPTTAELGFEGLDTIGVMHRVVLAPAGIPDDRLEVLRKAFAQLPENKTYQKLMAKLGENTEQMGGAAYQKVRAQQAQRYQKLVDTLTQ
ncbi:MAG: Bug family tripartite tricarboxylate transporter substrate binding protein [Geminicoccaceae bacterium]